MAAPALDRDEFTRWLEERAASDDVAGRAGDGYADPLARYYLSRGYRGFAGRLCFFLNADPKDRTMYPRWAEVMVHLMDQTFVEEEDNGWAIVPASELLELLKGISR